MVCVCDGAGVVVYCVCYVTVYSMHVCKQYMHTHTHTHNVACIIHIHGVILSQISLGSQIAKNPKYATLKQQTERERVCE